MLGTNIKVGLNRLPFATLVAFPMPLHFFILLYCTVSAVNELEVVDCTQELTFLTSCDLFSLCKKLCVVRALVK